MFQGRRFVTSEVANGVPTGVQRFLWNLIDNLVAKRLIDVDYLQVFELVPVDGEGQKIIHRQEAPEYHEEYIFDKVVCPLSIKVYVIDDVKYATMLLPSEK